MNNWEVRIELVVIYISSILILIFCALHLTDTKDEIIFSKDSGFYETEFDLSLTSPKKGVIYYTLDGSTPDENSNIYVDEIHIFDATNNPNIYSARTDVSTGFYVDLIHKYCKKKEPGYSVPNYLVKKCTMVRAKVYYEDNTYSNVITKVYFVCGGGNVNNDDNYYTVCIITDPDALFDNKNGIYVTGSAFETFDIQNSEYKDEWWFWDANYRIKGKETERESVIVFFKNNRHISTQECGIRIRGGGSRGYNPKSLNVYSKKGKQFNISFWGNTYRPDNITLFAGGVDLTSKLKDYIVHNLSRNLNFATLNFSPSVLYLDGEYWGCYWITEKQDEKYFKEYYGVDKNNIVYIKNEKVELGFDEDIELYNEMIDFCTNSDFTLDENYAQLASMIDIDSFIDYYAMLIYLGRYGDWPIMNEGVWRCRTKCDNRYNDERWRWCLFDCNGGCMDENQVIDNTYYRTVERSNMFYNIMKNKYLKDRLLNRIRQLSNNECSDINVSKLLTEFRSVMDELMVDNMNRFYGNDSFYLYQKEVNGIEEFLYKRNDIIEELLSQIED